MSDIIILCLIPARIIEMIFSRVAVVTQPTLKSALKPIVSPGS